MTRAHNSHSTCRSIQNSAKVSCSPSLGLKPAPAALVSILEDEIKNTFYMENFFLPNLYAGLTVCVNFIMLDFKAMLLLPHITVEEVAVLKKIIS